MLKSYLKKIFKITNQGDAREESYYSTLEAFLKETAKSFGKQKIHITAQRALKRVILISGSGMESSI